MFEGMKQLFLLARKTKKIWLVPIFLILTILALLIIGAQIAPVPVLLYPLI